MLECKQKLDELLRKYNPVIVGSGYIDIILRRANYEVFIKDITDLDVRIEQISWWDHITNDKEKPIGGGGPASEGQFFSEIYYELDRVPEIKNIQDQPDVIQSIIENKCFEFDGVEISFKNFERLTPGFWLSVDESWSNPF